jgi:hypothetical protein
MFAVLVVNTTSVDRPAVMNGAHADRQRPGALSLGTLCENPSRPDPLGKLAATHIGQADMSSVRPERLFVR